MDAFVAGGWNIFADKVSFDRKLAMAAVNEDSELNLFRAAEIIEGIHGGADSAAAKQDIIDENNGFAGDIKRNDGGEDIRSGALIEVIPMHADIEAAFRDRVGPNIGEETAKTLSEGDASTLNAYKGDFVAELVSFGNFVSDPGKGTVEG